MPDPLKNNDKLLSRTALDRVPPEVSLIPTLLMDLYALKNLLNETGSGLEGIPGMLFIRIHQFHGKYLYMVLAAVYKTSSIEDSVNSLDSNVRDYIRYADQLAGALEKALNVPLPHKGNFAFGVMAPLLAQNKEYVQVFNAYLDGYQAMLERALESAEACYDAGKKMEEETDGKLAEIRQAIAELEAANKIDALLKDVYKKKLEMIEFDIKVRVQDGRSKAESYIKRLHDAWKGVKDAGRLTYTGK